MNEKRRKEGMKFQFNFNLLNFNQTKKYTNTIKKKKTIKREEKVLNTR